MEHASLVRFRRSSSFQPEPDSEVAAVVGCRRTVHHPDLGPASVGGSHDLLTEHEPRGSQAPTLSVGTARVYRTDARAFAGPELRVGEWRLVPELLQPTPPAPNQSPNPNPISHPTTSDPTPNQSQARHPRTPTPAGENQPHKPPPTPQTPAPRSLDRQSGGRPARGLNLQVLHNDAYVC